MQFTLEGVNCVGACALGPVVIVDETYHGKVRQKQVAKILKQAKKQTAKD
jgi:NADH-quinone oxidoreductase subunit E